MVEFDEFFLVIYFYVAVNPPKFKEHTHLAGVSLMYKDKESKNQND